MSPLTQICQHLQNGATNIPVRYSQEYIENCNVLTGGFRSFLKKENETAVNSTFQSERLE